MIANRVKLTILRCMTGNGEYVTICPNCYIGLFKAVPVDDATGSNYPTYSEVTWTGYSRQFLGECQEGSSKNNVMYVEMSEGKASAISVDNVYFGEIGEGDLTAASHFGLFDSKTGNNLVAWGEIQNESGTPTPLSPEAGKIPIIKAGSLKITLE